MAGAYSSGQRNYDMRRGDSGELEVVLGSIRAVPAPENDPAFGPEGPLTALRSPVPKHRPRSPANRQGHADFA